MPPAASRFSFSETTPSNGALQHQAVDHLLRALHREHAPCCASPATTASDAWLVAARDLTSSSSCASRRCASSSDSTFFCASIGGDELVAHRVELGAAHVEPRREQRDVVLRRLHGGVGLHLDDFLLGLGHLRLRLLERELLIGRIELHHHVVRLDRHAGRHQLDDAERARRPAA